MGRGFFTYVLGVIGWSGRKQGKICHRDPEEQGKGEEGGGTRFAFPPYGG